MMAVSIDDLSHATVLVVNNDIYDLVVKHLTEYLGKDAAEKFNSQDFSRQLRDNAEQLCQDRDVIDLTPLLATCRAQLVMAWGLLLRTIAQVVALCELAFGEVARPKMQTGHV
eukprot:s9478_g2.t1